ncbi:hypothetical protein EI94DRAFT_1786428 [Lactarius quietus]|nr:hypothetical protein EI94DRAFT_1786428 [Lactarius quietus]
MSQAQATPEVNAEAGVNLQADVEGGNGDTDNRSYPPQHAQNDGEIERESTFVDGSDHFFTMYTEMAGEDDKKMAERWQKDADGILVFTGLFSAAVAALIAISIQALQSNPQDTTAFYVALIYQLLAEGKGQTVTLPSLPKPASSFTPPKYAIWVNAFWFLSLAISLTCALLATLLQQWARRYIRRTQPRYSPHKRGRIRAFYAEGVDNLHLPWAVEALPALLHLSLFLFFAGLLVFLFNTNHGAFAAVAWWIAFLTTAYLFITFMPLFRYESPYYAPLSSSAWFVATGVLTLTFQLLCWLDRLECFSDNAWEYLDKRRKHYREWFVRGLSKSAEEFARTLSPAIDGRALMWTLGSSDEDQELLRFFEGIPGFCNSEVLTDPIGACIKPNMERLTEALIGLVHRTITSNLVAPKTKARRLVICREAMKAASLCTNPQVFRRIICGEWDGLLSSFDFGLFLGDAVDSDPVTAYHSQAILSIILPRVHERERDERWFQLAIRHLGFQRPVLANYLEHGDSLSLATSIRIFRDIIHTHFDSFWLGDPFTRWKVLERVSQFDIRGTLPTLKHDFCDLWNEVVDRAKSSDPRIRSISIAILRYVRNSYIALHQGTDSAPTAFSASTADDDHALILSSSYLPCKESDHRLSIYPPGLSFPTPQHLVPNLTSTATTTSAPPTAQTGTTPAFYVNVAAAPHSVTPLTPPTFPIPVLDNPVGPSLAPQLATGGAPFEPETDSSTSFSTLPVAFPLPTVASDRGAPAGAESGVDVALRNDDATDHHSADSDHVTNVNASSPPPPPLRPSADIAIGGPSLSSRDAQQRGNQSSPSLHDESTRKP